MISTSKEKSKRGGLEHIKSKHKPASKKSEGNFQEGGNRQTEIKKND